MRPTLSLVRREFTAYFYSPIAYVVMSIFLAATGHAFYLSLALLTVNGGAPIVTTYPVPLGSDGSPIDWGALSTVSVTVHLEAGEGPRLTDKLDCSSSSDSSDRSPLRA